MTPVYFQLNNNLMIQSKDEFEKIQHQVISLHKRQIKNARQSSFNDWKVLIFEFLISSISIICIAIAILINEYGECSLQLQYLLRQLMSFFTMITIFFIICHKLALRKYMKILQNDFYNVSYLSGALELFIIAPHPNNYFNSVQLFQSNGNSHNIDDVLTIFVLFRTWFAGKFFIKCFYHNGSRSLRILQFFGNSSNSSLSMEFTIKSFFRQSKVISLLALFFINIVIITYIVKLSENETSTFLTDELSTLYFGVITMTTIGYGDLTPKSDLGKFFTALLIVSGVFLSSLFIVDILKALELSEKEKRCRMLIRRLHNKQIKKSRSMQILRNYINKYDSHKRVNKQDQQFEDHKFEQLWQMEGIHIMNELKKLTQKQILTNNLITFIIERLNAPLIEPIKKKLREKDKREINALNDQVFDKTYYKIKQSV